MKRFSRVAVATGLALAFVFGSLALMTGSPAEAASCRRTCFKEYRQCQRICSKNPCFASCETVLEICLANCQVK